jgi:hypothetical protein
MKLDFGVIKRYTYKTYYISLSCFTSICDLFTDSRMFQELYVDVDSNCRIYYKGHYRDYNLLITQTQML